MIDDMNHLSSREWLPVLLEYQAGLRWQLQEGCKPAEYSKLAALEQAVELVVQRLKLTTKGVNSHGL